MSYPAHIGTIFNFHSSYLKTWRITENLEFSFWSNSLYPIIHLCQAAYISLSMICPSISISDVCTVSHSKVILISWLYDSIYNFLNNFTLLILFFLCCSEQSFQHFFLSGSSPFIKSNTSQCIKQKQVSALWKEGGPSPSVGPFARWTPQNPGVLEDHLIIVQSRQ